MDRLFWCAGEEIILYFEYSFMRLLISYKGINKILRDVQTYSGIVKFVNENFFLKLSKWTITYIDSDGDRIALDSEIDVQNMLSSATKDHLKAVV